IELGLITLQVGILLPCGFCGRSGRPECAVFMKKKGNSYDVSSNCLMYQAFSYGAAEKGSRATPSRNVPLICRLCPIPRGRVPVHTAVWRYNMPEHIRLRHSNFATPGSPEGDRLPWDIWKDIEVDAAEERALGVPDALV
ncbi:hypothetical protein C8J56DRAFT_709556, partial [Mycena floridula]